jgi:UDP-galactose transporter B1
MTSPASASPRWLKFLIGAGGIYASYIYYGLIQEKIFNRDYTSDSDEKFTFSFAVLLFQNLFSFILARSINVYYYNQDKSKMDLKTELTIGGCNFGTMICANTALSFVSYPVQALMKSSKIISILMVSLCFPTSKKFGKMQYVSGLIITTGIIVFNVFQGKSKGEKESSAFGLILLVISLFCDGLIGVKQTEAKEKFKPSAFDQMESCNKWCLLLTFIFSLVTFQMGPFIFFCLNYPAVMADLVVIALLGTLGQVFIFYTIFNFSPFVLSIVTTTRKFFTVLASIFFYNHAVNQTQWASIALVFLGVAIEFYNENQKKHAAEKSTVKLPVSKEDASVELSHVNQVNHIRHENENDKLK